MTDRPCDLRPGHLFAHCNTCNGTEHNEDFACADWAEQLTRQARTEELQAFIRETRHIFPEVKITAAHVARRFAITEAEAAERLMAACDET